MPRGVAPPGIGFGCTTAGYRLPNAALPAPMRMPGQLRRLCFEENYVAPRLRRDPCGIVGNLEHSLLDKPLLSLTLHGSPSWWGILDDSTSLVKG